MTVTTWLDEVKSIYMVFDERFPDAFRKLDGLSNEVTDNVNDPCYHIYVYVYDRFIYSTESQKGLRRTYFQGFNKPSTFQMEDYSVIPPMADFRRTIYWNPEVKTNRLGIVDVKFYNNSYSRSLTVSVEGMTDSGVAISQD